MKDYRDEIREFLSHKLKHEEQDGYLILLPRGSEISASYDMSPSELYESLVRLCILEPAYALSVKQAAWYMAEEGGEE